MQIFIWFIPTLFTLFAFFLNLVSHGEIIRLFFTPFRHLNSFFSIDHFSPSPSSFTPFLSCLRIPSSIPPQSPLPLLPIAYRTREWKALISKTLCLSSMFVWWREGGRERGKKEGRKKEKPLKITYDIVVNGQMFVNAGLIIEFILHRLWISYLFCDFLMISISFTLYVCHSYNKYTSLIVNVMKVVCLSSRGCSKNEGISSKSFLFLVVISREGERKRESV